MQSNAHLEKKPQYDYVMKTDDKEIVMTKCTDEKDLGVVFDGQLRFDKHIHLFTAKANRMLGLVKRAFPYMDADTFTKLFKSLVRPHLEYGNASGTHLALWRKCREEVRNFLLDYEIYHIMRD